MADKKITNAGYRVLELLKELAQRPLSPNELLNIIEEKTDNSYRKELVNKYLNTLKLLNISLCKVKDKYYLEKSFEQINFDKTDLSLLKFMQIYLNKMQCNIFKEELQETMQIIERNFSEQSIKELQDKSIKSYMPYFNIDIQDNNAKIFEQYCLEKFKLKIQYKETTERKEQQAQEENSTYKIAPIKVLYKKGQAILFAYCLETNAHKEFLIKNIIDTQQLPQLSQTYSPSSVTFKLKNRLAQTYKLKQNESIIEFGKDYIIVSNNFEDKDLILKRLIRYFDSCEILYPKAMKEKMLKLIEQMENIYV